MARSNGLLALLVCAGFLVACQGDQAIPSEPGRELDLTAGGRCRDATFSSAAAIYTDSSVKNSKLQACKDILALAKQNKLGQAEVGIDDLLVGIYTDYTGGAAGLAAVGSSTLEQSVANYIEAACGLASLTDSECLTPNDLDIPGDGTIDADDLKGWLAAGPLNSTGMDLAKGVLANGLFGFGVEEAAGTYIFVASQRRADKVGPCPENFPNDCQPDVFDVDVDGSFTSVYVESCAVFGVKHVRCPDGQGCEFGDTDVADLGQVLPSACGVAGYHMMGFWRKLAYQATSPAQWVIRATPAYAGLTSKFGAFSPVVLADGDPRARGVICDITANYPSGSAGTTCRILDQGQEIASCVSVSTGTYSSSCSMAPLVPEDLALLVTAEKTGGDGAYNASQPLTLGPADPARGQTKTATFNLQPPGKKKNN
ncbi:hypothetical protein BH20GEM1_BH20GEM1_06980 [soil metagenome]